MMSNPVTAGSNTADERAKRRAQIAKIPYFGGLSDELLGDFATKVRFETRHPGEIVVRSGDPADSLFAILEGVVSVQVPHRRQAEPIELRAGEVFGENCLLDLSRRSANVLSRGRMLAIECDASVIREFSERDSSLNSALWQLLSRRQLANFAGSSPLLAALSAEDRREVLRCCRLSKIAAGAPIQRSGAEVQQVWIPLTGALMSEGPGGKRRLIRPGQVFGGRSLRGQKPAASKVTARGDMLCLRIPKQGIAALEARSPSFVEMLADCSVAS